MENIFQRPPILMRLTMLTRDKMSLLRAASLRTAWETAYGLNDRKQRGWVEAGILLRVDCATDQRPLQSHTLLVLMIALFPPVGPSAPRSRRNFATVAGERQSKSWIIQEIIWRRKGDSFFRSFRQSVSYTFCVRSHKAERAK